MSDGVVTALNLMPAVGLAVFIGIFIWSRNKAVKEAQLKWTCLRCGCTEAAYHPEYLSALINIHHMRTGAIPSICDENLAEKDRP